MSNIVERRVITKFLKHCYSVLHVVDQKAPRPPFPPDLRECSTKVWDGIYSPYTANHMGAVWTDGGGMT
jgi:hypothetical protein